MLNAAAGGAANFGLLSAALSLNLQQSASAAVAAASASPTAMESGGLPSEEDLQTLAARRCSRSSFTPGTAKGDFSLKLVTNKKYH